MVTYASFNMKEWQAVEEQSEAAWKKKYLGERPTRSAVRKNVPGGVQMDAIAWVAFVLLVLVVAFSGFKAALAYVPVANSMYDHTITEIVNTHPELMDTLPLIPTRQAFISISQLMTFMLAELGMIYFMLAAPSVGKAKPPVWSDRGYGLVAVGQAIWWTVQPSTFSPHLLGLAVWGTIAFVIQISSTGNGTVIDKYLPIVVGLGLSVFVEEKLREWKLHRDEVSKALRTEQLLWDERLEGMWLDRKFITVLYNVLWEHLLNLHRVKDGRKYRPNAHLEALSGAERKTISLAEYNRMKGDLDFADDLKSAVRHEAQEAKAEKVKSGGKTADVRRFKSVNGGEDEVRRVPPNGMPAWTVDTLLADLAHLGVKPHEADRNFIRNTYAPEYRFEGILAAYRKRTNAA